MKSETGQGTAKQQECDAIYAHRMEGLLGACWQDQSIDLKGMDVVYCNGELEPRICNQARERVVGYDGKYSKQQ